MLLVADEDAFEFFEIHLRKKIEEIHKANVMYVMTAYPIHIDTYKKAYVC